MNKRPGMREIREVRGFLSLDYLPTCDPGQAASSLLPLLKKRGDKGHIRKGWKTSYFTHFAYWGSLAGPKGRKVMSIGKPVDGGVAGPRNPQALSEAPFLTDGASASSTTPSTGFRTPVKIDGGRINGAGKGKPALRFQRVKVASLDSSCTCCHANYLPCQLR